MASTRKRLVVVGNGMVSHRLVELLRDRGPLADFEVSVIGEEPRPAYDRVNLSKFFEGKDAEGLALASAADYERAGVELILGDPVVALDRAARRLRTHAGRELTYDRLVLATGSSPFVPPIE